MTVHELIDRLQNIKDKDKKVAVVIDGYYSMLSNVEDVEYVLLRDKEY